MTTNQPIRMTDDEIGALAESFRITKTTPRPKNVGGTWVDGTMGGHRFQALVFESHADDPGYELGDSRISKLWLLRIADKTVAANFDRGWDVEPTTDDARAIVDLLASALAEMVFNA